MQHLQFNQDAAKSVKPRLFERRDDKDNLMNMDGSDPTMRPLPPRNSLNLDASSTGLETRRQQADFLRRLEEDGEAT